MINISQSHSRFAEGRDVQWTRFQYPTVFLLAAIYEGTYSLWSWSVANNLVWLAVLATFILPFIQLVEVVLIIEAQGWKHRIVLAAATAAGYATGTAVLLLYVRGEG